MRQDKTEIKKFIKTIKSKVYPLIDFKQRHNALYGVENILNILIHSAMTNDFTTNGTKTYRLINDTTPHQNTVWYNLKKLNVAEIQDQFESIFEKIYQTAKKQRVFNKPVDVAIDTTEIMYYGDENDSMVVKTKYKDGTNLAYRFATLNVVEVGKRFTLMALPMSQLTTNKQVLERLIKYAKKRVKIRYVYVDRGFFNGGCINTLEELKVTYLMPAVRNSRIKPLVVKHEPSTIINYTLTYWTNFTRKDLNFKLIILMSNKNPKDKVVFATNIETVYKKNAKAVCDNYSKRWGIETAYRVKNNFRVKTTSKNYVVRLFYFMFSVCLYNLWILATVFIGVLLGKVLKTPTISAKMFGTLFYIDDEG